jgi:hypothetical protein
VIVSGKVQESVQYENTNLVFSAMTQFARIRESDIDRYCEITSNFRGKGWRSRKRNDVRGLVLPTEAAIQLAHLSIRGEENADRAFDARCLAGCLNKTAQSRFAHSVDLFFDR